jgi:hypothetical protein
MGLIFLNLDMENVTIMFSHIRVDSPAESPMCAAAEPTKVINSIAGDGLRTDVLYFDLSIASLVDCGRLGMKASGLNG